jgi:polysaccharide export outer membrane protein
LVLSIAHERKADCRALSRRPYIFVIILVVLSPFVTGCTFISASGPTRDAIVSGPTLRVQNPDKVSRLNYALVPVDGLIVQRMPRPAKEPTFSTDFTDRSVAKVNIGVGDILTVSIFESGSGGLFTPGETANRSGSSVTVAPQQVDPGGDITVPFGGVVHAAGLSPFEVSRIIQQRIEKRALEPQVIVSLTERHSNEVAVLGDGVVGAGASTMRFPLDPGGLRLLGAIARAGGPKYPAYETLVTVQREGHAESALLSNIAERPEQNIEIQPGDVVYVAHKQKYFVAFGATGQSTTLSLLNRRFAFGDEVLSLADALAIAGGLEDDRANSTGVFIYRIESRQTLENLGIFDPRQLSDFIPTIYLINMNDPTGLFLSSLVPLHSGDLLYVSNAPAADLQKFLNLIGSATGSTAAIRSTVQ